MYKLRTLSSMPSPNPAASVPIRLPWSEPIPGWYVAICSIGAPEAVRPSCASRRKMRVTFVRRSGLSSESASSQLHV